MKKIIFLLIFLFGSVGTHAFAYVPYIIEQGPISVENPETSHMFFDTLSGSPRIYRIESEEEFDLFIKIFAPKKTNETFSGYVSRVDGDLETFVGVLDEKSVSWEISYKPLEGDWYRNGPEFNGRVPRGIYRISIFNEENKGQYALSIGSKNSFSVSHMARMMAFLPKLKSDFSGTSHFSMFLSPFGWAWSVIIAVCIILAWKAIFFIGEKYIVISEYTKERFKKNLGKKDRRIRFYFGLAVFVFGVGFWNWGLMGVGGFFLFEAFFGWSAIYALLEKNTRANSVSEEKSEK